MAIETKTIHGYRFYHIGTQWLPSVTSVIKIKPNPRLEAWKQRHTEEQVRLVSEYTAERGELIHYGALRAYETDTITQELFDPESLRYYSHYPQMKEEIRVASKLFREFRRTYQLIPVTLEKVVWNEEYEYAGRCDFVGELVDNDNGSKTRILMDIKTSKEIYEDSVSRQLSAYNHALNNWADKLYVLLLHPGKTTINGVEIGADTPYWVFQEVEANFEGFQNRLEFFQIVYEKKILTGEWKQ